MKKSPFQGTEQNSWHNGISQELPHSDVSGYRNSSQEFKDDKFLFTMLCSCQYDLITYILFSFILEFSNYNSMVNSIIYTQQTTKAIHMPLVERNRITVC